MKSFIHNIKILLDQNYTFSNQSKEELLKYEIPKRSIAFSKPLPENLKKNMHYCCLKSQS